MTAPAMTAEGRSTSPADEADRLAYVALALIPALGPRRLAALLSRCGSASDAIRNRRWDRELVQILTRSVINDIHRLDLDAVRSAVARHAERGLQVIVPRDPVFPAALRGIPDPPTLLWCRGRIDVFEFPAIGIVGSRDHTAYGADVTRTMAAAAAAAGIVVVSGMARGLDAIAHAAALDAGFVTIGVLGSGVDVVYPVSNAKLFARIPAAGVLISEHPPGERAFPSAFARRNRLISGLARVLIVAEAAPDSGTMLTVASALEQGRDVLAAPGSIFTSTSRGTNRLIHDGATPLLDPEQFLRLYGVDARSPRPPVVAPPPCTLSPTEARVFNALCDGGRQVDDLALAVGIPVGELLATLLGLELGGHVEQGPGNLFRRVAG